MYSLLFVSIWYFVLLSLLDRDSPSHSFRARESAAAAPGGAGGGVGFADESGEPNPFTLPKEDVFLMREREKAQKTADRERLQRMKIWDKPAKSSQLALQQTTGAPVSTTYQDRVAERQKYLSTTLNTAGSL